MRNEFQTDVGRRERPFRGTWWVSTAGYTIDSGYLADRGSLGITPEDSEFTLMDGQDFYESWGIDPTSQEALDIDWLAAKEILIRRIHLVRQVDSRCYFRYNPLTRKGLHREFAELKQSKDAVCEFANTYGLLGLHARSLTRHGSPSVGEPLWHWYSQIELAAGLLRVWDLYRDPTTRDKVLARHLCLFDGWVSLQDPPRAPDSNTLPEHGLHRFVETHAGQTEAPAESVMRQAARTLLQGELSHAANHYTKTRISLEGGPRIVLEAKHLLGAIYIQFAEEVLGRAEPLTRCGSCAKWFVAKHASRKFCSDACKMKAYRRGQKQGIPHGS